MHNVLLVEDEPLISDLLADALREAGFCVTEAACTHEARAALAVAPASFDVLVTDVNIGARDWGFEFARLAREANPRLKVIYITGHGEADFRAMGVVGSQLLAKPFAPYALVEAVRATIVGHPNPRA